MSKRRYVPTASVPPLFQALVDDAGLFPPEQLPMDAALARHRADQRRAHPMLTHRFLCPASRLPELRAGLAPGDLVVLALILDTGLDGLGPALDGAASEPGLHLELVEVPLPPDGAGEALAALAEVPAPVFLEPPRGPGWLDAVGVVAGWAEREDSLERRGLKVRCGGVKAELFPSPGELASFVCACWAAGVSFKATAGLHHAVRAADEGTGFVHHGFLNLLVAAAEAANGGSEESVAEVLACNRAEALVAEAREMPAERAMAARSLFLAYGSCSTSEPLADVVALGLLS
jgi:hypothetical protein